MKRFAVALVAGAALSTAACDDDTRAQDAGCAHCCNCRCTDDIISIDATDRCLDCANECLDICDRYGGGGGEGSESCEAP